MAYGLKERKKYRGFEIATFFFSMFIFLIFPLWVNAQGYSGITECKYHSFRSASLIYFISCALIFLYWLAIKKKNVIKLRSQETSFEITLPQILIAVYVLWNAFSALTSKYGKATWMGEGRFEGMFSCILYSTVFILCSFFNEYSKHYQRAISVAALGFSLLAFLQFFKDGVIYPEGYGFWQYRFMSTIGNVDMVGGLVALLLPVIFCSYVYEDEKKYWNIIYLAAIFFLTYSFIVADVDSGKVGILVGLLFAICFLVDERKGLIRSLEAMGTFSGSFFLCKFLNVHDKKFNPAFGKKALVLLLATIFCFALAFVLKKIKFSFGWSKDKARRIAFIILTSCIVFALVFLFFYNGDIRLLNEASEILHFRLSDNAGSGRGYLWKSALGLACETPIKGNGPGTFGESYKHLDRFSTYTDFAHNDFIQIAVCTGFVGVAIYVAFIISLAVRALKTAPKCNRIVIFGSACAAYLAHSFFSFSLAIVTPLFWVMAGIVDKMVRQTK